MYLPPFRYFAPDSVDEALELLRRHLPDAKILAGGQSLLPLMSLGLARPTALIDLNGLTALERVTEDGGSLQVGALTRHRALETSLAIRKRWPLLAEAASLIGNIRVRHRGTIGGSLAHADPAAELPMVASALEAILEIRGPAGPREVSADKFFLGYLQTALAPDEIVTGVRFPAPGPLQGYGLAELVRRAGDFALVAACAILEADGTGRCTLASLAIGGVGPQPLRARAAEALLIGQTLTGQLLDGAAGAVSEQVAPESDVHASAPYRRQMARVMARRALGAAAAPLMNGETRLA